MSSKIITIKLRERDVKLVDELRLMLQANNRTETVERVLRMVYNICHELNYGSQIQVIRENGDVFNFSVKGLPLHDSE